MTVLRCATIALLLSASAVASGTEQDSWYLDLGLGVSVSPDMKLNDSGAKAEFDLGVPIGSFAIGRTFSRRWRLEAELGFLDNDLENYFWPTGDDVVRADSNDGVQSTSFMLNGIRQFQLGALKPYLGLGLGATRARLEMSREATIWPTEAPREVQIDDAATTLAWQAIVGFDVPLTSRWDLGVDYRYWHAGSIEITAENGAELDVKHRSHSARLHVRYFLSEKPEPYAASYPKPIDSTWHLSASFGGGWAMDSEFSVALDNLDAFALGSVYLLALERRLTRRWSLALEAAWRQNHLEVVDFGDPLGEFGASGQVKAASLSLNGIYQFRPERAIRPYLGLGAGLARVQIEAYTRDQEYLDDEDDAPALQLIGGANIALTKRLDFVTELRTWYAQPINVELPDGRGDETWHWVFSAQLGLRYAL